MHTYQLFPKLMQFSCLLHTFGNINKLMKISKVCKIFRSTTLPRCSVCFAVAFFATFSFGHRHSASSSVCPTEKFGKKAISMLEKPRGSSSILPSVYNLQKCVKSPRIPKDIHTSNKCVKCQLIFEILHRKIK